MWAVSVWLRDLGFLPIALQSFAMCALAGPGQRSETAGKVRQERDWRQEGEKRCKRSDMDVLPLP